MTLSIRPDSATFDVRAGATQHGGITALFLGCQVNPNLWVPVKKLIWDERGYRMGCVTGVKLYSDFLFVVKTLICFDVN